MPVKIRSVKVQEVSRDFDLLAKLPRPQIFEWITRPVLSDEEVEPFIVENVEIDNQEIVEWMVLAAKAMAPLDVMTATTNSVGGAVVARSGDPYIPGVTAGVCKALSWTGEVVKSRGYGMVATPAGKFKVPIGKAVTFTNKDVLAWATTLATYIKQWVLALINWLKPPVAPFDDRVSFPIVGKFTAPQFVSVEPAFMSPIVLNRIGFTSEKDQKVTIKLRGTKGKYQDVYDQTEVEIPAGQSEVLLWSVGFPNVEKYTIHIQPQHGVRTILDYVKVLP